MTDFDPDRSDADDELASAYLDDEVTADERARVEGDPALLARVDGLRSARDALRAASFEAVTETRRDEAIRAAIGQSPLIALAAARSRRRVQVASIAAAVVLVLAVAGVL